MEYTVKQLARLSGVSARTLRYYDEIGLLKPGRVSSNGYRIYGQGQVDTLQQILFYRALGVRLEEIKTILTDPSFDRQQALQSHLTALNAQKAQLERLIQTVSKTICAMKGEASMNDTEKFEGFKKDLVERNEAAYGTEVRTRYGDEAVDAMYQTISAMPPEQWQEAEKLRTELEGLLKAAMEQCDPAGEAAIQACELHRRWLCLFWKAGSYSKKAHRSMGEMYVADDRFRAYYDAHVGPGGADFFQSALKEYTR